MRIISFLLVLITFNLSSQEIKRVDSEKSFINYTGKHFLHKFRIGFFLTRRPKTCLIFMLLEIARLKSSKGENKSGQSKYLSLSLTTNKQ